MELSRTIMIIKTDISQEKLLVSNSSVWTTSQKSFDALDSKVSSIILEIKNRVIDASRSYDLPRVVIKLNVLQRYDLSLRKLSLRSQVPSLEVTFFSHKVLF